MESENKLCINLWFHLNDDDKGNRIGNQVLTRNYSMIPKLCIKVKFCLKRWKQDIELFVGVEWLKLCKSKILTVNNHVIYLQHNCNYCFSQRWTQSFIPGMISYTISDLKNETKTYGVTVDGGNEYYNYQWTAMLLLWHCSKCHMSRLWQVQRKIYNTHKSSNA